MTVTIKATNIELTPAIRKYATDKIAVLAKFLPSLLSAKIDIGRTTKHHAKGLVWRAEVNMHGPQRLLRAEAVADDLYAAIDQVQSELKNELKRFKEKKANVIRKQQRAKRG